jgi:hypothetical protein
MVLGSGIRDPGSGIRKKPIPDPGSRGQKAPDPGSGSATLPICNKEFKYLNLPKIFLSSRKYDPGCSSRIRIPDLGSRVKKGIQG